MSATSGAAGAAGPAPGLSQPSSIAPIASDERRHKWETTNPPRVGGV